MRGTRPRATTITETHITQKGGDSSWEVLLKRKGVMIKATQEYECGFMVACTGQRVKNVVRGFSLASKSSEEEAMQKQKMFLVVVLGSILLVNGIAGADTQIGPIDSWYMACPVTGKNIVAKGDTIQVVYIPTPFGDGALYWAYSEDGGATWSEMGPLDWGLGATYVSMAIDKNGTPYITFRDRKSHGPLGTRAIWFIRDESYGAGLWREPVLLSDTMNYSMLFTSIQVSPSGDTIAVAADCYEYEKVVHDTTRKIESIFFTKSVDGGLTWTPMEIIVHGDSFPPYEVQDDTLAKYLAENPSLNMGTDGYLFLTFGAKEHPEWDWQIGYVISEDWGETWSSPKFLPKPDGWDWTWNWWATYADGIVVDNIPHTAAYFTDGTYRRVFEYHLEDGDWVYQVISPARQTIDDKDVFGDAEQATFGVDAQGRLYVCFLDYDTQMGVDRNAFVVGSPDGGKHWSAPLRVSQATPGADTHYVHIVEMAENVGAKGYVIYEDAGWWATPTAVWFASFSTDPIWLPENWPPTVTNVTDYGNTYQTTGNYIVQATIDDETGITEAKLIYAIGTDTTEVDMTPIGDKLYEAAIPAQPVGTRIEYYVKAVDTDANVVLNPTTAPDVGYAILVLPTDVLAYDDGVATSGISGTYTGDWTWRLCAVRFTPLSTDTITGAKVFIWAKPDTFVVFACEDDGTGHADTAAKLTDRIEVAAVDSLVWVDVEFPTPFVPAGDFHIVVDYVKEFSPEIGNDESRTYERSFMIYYFDPTWGWGWYGGPYCNDIMIRAVTKPVTHVGGPYAVDDHTMLLMHFDGDLTDASGKTAGGTGHGSYSFAATSVHPTLGSCLYLDNDEATDTSCITVPDTSALDLTGSFTVEAWFNLQSAGESWQIAPRILAKPDGIVNPWYCPNYWLMTWYYGTDTSFSAGYFVKPWVWVDMKVDANVLQLNKWYHFAFIYDTTCTPHQARIAVHDENDSLLAYDVWDLDPATQEPPKPTDAPLYIGFGGGGNDSWFDGYIDEIRISNIARSFPGVGVAEESTKLPSVYLLSQNYPNPISKATTISFIIPKAEHVDLKIYNLAGQCVKVLMDEDRKAGSYNVVWNGTDDRGQKLPSGIYFYRLKAGDWHSTKKLIILR